MQPIHRIRFGTPSCRSHFQSPDHSAHPFPGTALMPEDSGLLHSSVGSGIKAPARWRRVFSPRGPDLVSVPLFLSEAPMKIDVLTLIRLPAYAEDVLSTWTDAELYAFERKLLVAVDDPRLEPLAEFLHRLLRQIDEEFLVRFEIEQML